MNPVMECLVDGCDRAARCRGWCDAHYQRVSKDGDPGPADIGPPVGKTIYEGVSCAVDGCDLQAKTKGYCHAHYRRVIKTGDPGRAAIGPDPARRLAPDELRQRMGSTMSQIDDPLKLAYKCLHQRGLLGHRDTDDLLSIALGAIVDAVLTWDPNGASLVTWAYLKMNGRLSQAVRVANRHFVELGRDHCISTDEWRFRSGTEWYDRIELRLDLQRWADLAELTPYQRFIIEWAAQHAGTSTNKTPLEGEPSPMTMHKANYRAALRHMRNAAITGERRDDQWTRHARAQREAEVA